MFNHARQCIKILKNISNWQCNYLVYCLNFVAVYFVQDFKFRLSKMKTVNQQGNILKATPLTAEQCPMPELDPLIRCR